MRSLLLTLLLLVTATLAAAKTYPVTVHYFWAEGCPHCVVAKPRVEALVQQHPGATLVDYEVWRTPANLTLMRRLTEQAGKSVAATPTIVVGERLWVGYDALTADEVRREVERCLAEGCRDLLAPTPAATSAPATPPPAATLAIPGVGTVLPDTLSLPLLTAVLGLLDSFNPCAFFVLLFLLSLLIHAHSRRTMWLVGGTFVVCSGAVYFLFMAAWLNLFLLAGQMAWVTVVAGVVAVLVALINIKDFYWFHRGVSLSIPESVKPGLFARMRGLTKSARLSTVLVGTLVLAVAANSYELLCTAGFPMLFTRVLTMHELPTWRYYAYLVAYNLVYVLPLLGIVAVFAATLGRHTLSEWQGRLLKLLSGVMMLLLGAALLWHPEWLAEPWLAAAILPLALLVTALLAWLYRWRRPSAA